MSRFVFIIMMNTKTIRLTGILLSKYCLPIVNGYRALCGGKDYNLREGDILIIGPCMIHELFAPEKGERIIFQPCLNHISTKEINLLTMIINPGNFDYARGVSTDI